eukprot:3100536-Rhodomonas_salina.1
MRRDEERGEETGGKRSTRTSDGRREEEDLSDEGSLLVEIVGVDGWVQRPGRQHHGAERPVSGEGEGGREGCLLYTSDAADDM